MWERCNQGPTHKQSPEAAAGPACAQIFLVAREQISNGRTRRGMSKQASAGCSEGEARWSHARERDDDAGSSHSGQSGMAEAV
eukprot:2252252-Pyramimonas_sp.AAC.1